MSDANMVKSWDGIPDAVLFVLVTIPVACILIMAPFCPGGNEGSWATCQPAFLDGLENTLGAFMPLLAFGGFVVVGPIVFFAAVASFVAKIFKYVRGFRPRTAFAIAREILTIVPLFVLAYLFYTLFLTS